ncbi:MAG: hypothetical protein JWO60_731 [Frankiales bacterium]|nr:hypothetical protein [Frankiales bacterium]
MHAPLASALVLLTLLAGAAPALASGGEDTTPGGSAALGFPLALVALAVAATVFALVWRAVSKKKTDR